MNTTLRVTDLRKMYRARAALDGVNLTIERGQLVCLIGPNGAGKSTLMRTITGLQAPDAGTVVVSGDEVQAHPALARRRTALVPQEVDLVEFLTTRETVELAVEVRSGPVSDHEQRIAAAVSACRLGDVVNTAVATLSGGTRRKVAIAAALASNPDVIVLDESFVGLDPESCFSLEAALRTYCDAGGAVLLASHTLDTVERIADRVVVMARGRVVEDLPIAEVRARLTERRATITDFYLDATGTR